MRKLRLGYQNGRAVIDLGPKGNAETDASGASELRFDSSIAGKSCIIVYSNQPGSDQYANVIGTYQWWSKNWNSGGATSFFDAANALDPQATEATICIDGTSKGQGKAEGSAMPAGFHVVAWNNGRGWGHTYGGVASMNAGKTDCGGMLLTEVFVFAETLTQKQIADATAFLMKKWGIGDARCAAPALTSVTAEKGGTVKLGTVVEAATLAGGGMIEAPMVQGVSAVNVRLTAEGIEKLTVAGTVALAAGGTVNLAVDDGVGKVLPGRYPVLKADVFAGDASVADWSVSLSRAFPSSLFLLRIVDDALCVEVLPKGTIFLIR